MGIRKSYAGWIRVGDKRRVLSWFFVACLALAGIEGVSSYILYRHYSTLHRGFYPVGSATVALAAALKARADGRHEQVDLSIDHGPLFHSDPVLGYAMFPGSYQITERNGGTSHRFSLTVDDLGHRVTSYQPRSVAKRLFITGDSAMFGWGLDDEQTTPWLLQTMFPKFDVVNLSLTSYSTVHAALQLERTQPAVSADDVVVLTYHPITNDFNVASAAMLYYLTAGFEQQLGDHGLVRDMSVPFAALDGGNAVVIGHYKVACPQNDSARPECLRKVVAPDDAIKITTRVFDQLMAAHPAHFLVAYLSGPDSDPVIAHLKARGVAIADLRLASSEPDANDEVSIDGHAGPFWHHALAERLAAALRNARLVEM